MMSHHRPTSAHVEELIRRLRETHPDARCALHHENPWQLLVATILSAQTTDERVNQVTPQLFARYPTPEALAAANRAEIEQILRPLGFYRQKARYIHETAQQIIHAFGGEVPDTMEALLTLPGVARKTANVVLGVAFGKAEGVVVDTHVKRLSRRLGLTDAETPQRIERDLMALLPREHWIEFSHLLIFHGRRICDARRPRCDECPLADLCPSATRLEE